MLFASRCWLLNGGSINRGCWLGRGLGSSQANLSMGLFGLLHNMASGVRASIFKKQAMGTAILIRLRLRNWHNITSTIF